MQKFQRLAILALFLTSVSASTICLAATDTAGIGEGSQTYYITFPAGKPCDLSVTSTLSKVINENFCAVMSDSPHFRLDGADAQFVNKGPEVKGFGCGAAIIVDNKKYDGRVISDNEKDPCGKICDSDGTRIVLGLKIYDVTAPYVDNTGTSDQDVKVGQENLPEDTT